MKQPAEYSLKEIRSQDKSFFAVSNTFGKIQETVKQAFGDRPDQVIFIGCGTSYYIASSICSYFIDNYDIPAFYLPCYELELNRESYLRNRKTLIIPFTRASTTSEVRSCIDKCRQLPNVKTLAITCDEGSSEYNDFIILCSDSSEQSIVMTRSYTSLLYAGMLMTKALAGSDASNLLKLHEACKSYITSAEDLAKNIAPQIRDKRHLISLGQGFMFGVAGETSIKIKEMCIIPTEVYFTMEYRHGPISIANNETLCFLYSNDSTTKDDIRLAKELKALGVVIITVGNSLDNDIKEIVDYKFEVPSEYLPLLILPAQFTGVYWALEKGLDPDTPRNLSKAIIL